MKRLTERKTELSSKKKMRDAMLLFERYVDEPIDTIRIYCPSYYTFNNRWSVNIATNEVSRSYDDI